MRWDFKYPLNCNLLKNVSVIFYSMHCVTVFCRCSTQYSFQLRALWCILITDHCIWCFCVIYLVKKAAWQRVNRKTDFFYKTNIFESIRITNRIDSIWIANWNALALSAGCSLLLHMSQIAWCTCVLGTRMYCAKMAKKIAQTTPWVRKTSRQTLAHNLSKMFNINRFSKFYRWQTQW